MIFQKFKNLREDKKVAYGTTIAILIFFLILIVLFQVKRMQDSSTVELTNALELDRELRIYYSTILEIETGQRGYLLTRESKYLDSYRKGSNAAQPALDRIIDRVKIHPEQVIRVKSIQRLSIKKIEEIDLSLQKEKEGDFQTAINFVKTDYGKQLMDSIRVEIQLMVNRQNEIVNLKKGKVERISDISSIAVAIGVLMILIIAFFVVLTVVPVVEQLISARDLEQENNELLSEKNDQLEHFAYTASHDLKEPLRTITNFIGVFKEDYQDKLGEETDVYFKFIEDAADRMRRLIEGLLKYSRLGKISNLQKTDLNELIEEIRKDLSVSIAEKNAVIKYERLPTVLCSRTEIRQVFQNLIINALKFCPPERAPVVTINAIERKKDWMFEVRDNGIGIEKGQQEKIFNIFLKLHRSTEFEGHGIGLAFCKKIIDLHKGKIWIKSEPGEGSSFFLTISKNLELTPKTSQNLPTS